jgi:hypothetical protein
MACVEHQSCNDTRVLSEDQAWGWEAHWQQHKCFRVGPKKENLTLTLGKSMAEMWITCRRGKKLQKHYTVMLCEVDAAARAAFQPQLNSEHREAHWWPLAGLPPPQQMHPVVVCPYSM